MIAASAQAMHMEHVELDVLELLLVEEDGGLEGGCVDDGGGRELVGGLDGMFDGVGRPG